MFAAVGLFFFYFLETGSTTKLGPLFCLDSLVSGLLVAACLHSLMLIVEICSQVWVFTWVLEI